MAISIDDIKKLRAMTGAGLADVKKALTEAEGDFDKAKELLRERGLAIILLSYFEQVQRLLNHVLQDS